MNNDLTRFSVAMPTSLCTQLDLLVARRGMNTNRSEVIRDLVREAIQEQEVSVPDTLVLGTLTIVYSHHANDLAERLHDIQHDFCDNIVSTTHVHVDAHTCLEVIILKGENEVVRLIADRILGTKGVRNGKLVLSAIKNGEEK
jgi:CopG family transcriptional regulator, nickel-responsive regulator